MTILFKGWLHLDNIEEGMNECHNQLLDMRHRRRSRAYDLWLQLDIRRLVRDAKPRSHPTFNTHTQRLGKGATKRTKYLEKHTGNQVEPMYVNELAYLESPMKSSIWSKDDQPDEDRDGNQNRTWGICETVKAKQSYTHNRIGSRVDPPTIKVTCDASWCKLTWTCNIGILARNSEGQLIGGLNRKMTNDDIEMLEAMTILYRTRLAIENEWKQVEIESDSRVVINHLCGNILYLHHETICLNIVTLIEWKTIQRMTNECAN